MDLDIFDSIIISDNMSDIIRGDIRDIILFDTFTVSDSCNNSILNCSAQMPLSRPQGSLRYGYLGGGSTSTYNGLSIGGEL